MDKGYRYPLLRILVYPHLWLALGAMAQVWWVGRFLGGAGPRSMIAVGSALVAAYGMMRIVRSLEPEPIASPWIRWVVEHRTAMVLLVLVAAALALWALHGLHRVFAPFDLLAVPATLLYLVPLQGAHGRSRGLRQVPYAKAPIIAGVWAMATTGLSEVPVTEGMQDLAGHLAILQFTFFLALAVAFDAMDLPYDPTTLRTVPQWLGAGGARGSSMLLMLPWTGWLLLLQVRQGGLDTYLLLPTIGYVAGMFLIGFSGAHRPRWYGQFVLDGLLLFIPLLALVGEALR